MPVSDAQFSTGLPGLDRVFRGLMAGDNVVWQVNAIEDYMPFVGHLHAHAVRSGRKIVYFRFADHLPLLPKGDGVEVCHLHPEQGFEPFLAEVHRTIKEAGRGSLFAFDCLSELAHDWCSDRMLGNFFMLSCPYVYDSGSFAYFAILRNHHSFHAVRPISNTTQILVDTYRHRDRLYVHPIKVQHRHSETMYMLHVWDGDEFRPVTQSYIITEILSAVPWSRLDSASYMLGFWSKTFAEAEEIQAQLNDGRDITAQADEYFVRLTRMLISHDERVLALARKYFVLRDILAVRRRMIGTGLIGGKSVGMLLARTVLETRDPRWSAMLEAHDSFYVGADVFYTYLVQNGCWWNVQECKGGDASDGQLEEVSRQLRSGTFPEYIVQQFADMLDYFGQAPIIVRSSSLLEDNFGNAFAGKYESVFCANQGGRQKRLQDFMDAVRVVYASTMSEEALVYRRQRGLLELDEQMALLIQRVSGASYGDYFYPQAAGVGFSFNPYVWHETIDPEAGMLRLVFGIGTRAVNRSDDDYTRVVALNAPQRRPEANFDEVREYAQRRVDVLDLQLNRLISAEFEDIVKRSEGLPLEMFASRDRRLERKLKQMGRQAAFPWVLTLDRLLSATRFVEDMREMLRVLQEAYEYPVDVEFTVNFFGGESYRINLVQCRPLQVVGPGAVTEPPETIDEHDLILRSEDAVIGKSTVLLIDWLVYVVPGVYGLLPERTRHEVATLIGKIAHHPEVETGTIMLLGPGRWGTTTPSLGVPVSFADITTVKVLCELVEMNASLVPDVSLGTHFFNELVENNMLYLALLPHREGNVLNREFLERTSPNCLGELLPTHAELANIVRVIDVRSSRGNDMLELNANTLKQRVVCYRRGKQPCDGIAKKPTVADV